MIFLSCKMFYEKNWLLVRVSAKGCPNPIELDKARSTITTLIASLRDVEANLQFHELLVKKEHNKIKDGEIELKDVHEKLRSILGILMFCIWKVVTQSSGFKV